MFTGLVQQTGILKSRSGNKIVIHADKAWDDLVYGESIAVNGCCLTLERETAPGVRFSSSAISLSIMPWG